MDEKKCRDGSKTREFKVRMSEEDMKKLEFASQIFDISKSDIIREGIERKYQMARYKK